MICSGVSISRYFLQGVNLHSHLFQGGRTIIFFRYHLFLRNQIDKDSTPGDLKSDNLFFETYWFLTIWSSIPLYNKKWNSPFFNPIISGIKRFVNSLIFDICCNFIYFFIYLFIIIFVFYLFFISF